ncbi:MAG: methylmalonyl Co-A mutase-associated GTPase MeaB [Alphaproteobacteria bacterium]|jgi:LAO/AO transport system kinase|nr:methylmalonyl Co-A mutase-associated GTPase MeaB [Alphaproteobacteria bacterium]
MNTVKITTPEAYIDGVLSGDLALLARAITLVESRHPRHRETADAVLNALLPYSGKATRVGITGVPGVGKSSFIEAFGRRLTATGHRIAVLAVDPTSSRTGGSILGDKTRMRELGRDLNAFIRPSPTSGTLGGVARATRESMIICEAAGFDVVLVETVGVGQSETTVAEMVDFFLALMLPGAGDDLQGIKKGILEIADMIAVNKADGDMAIPARRAAADYRRALEIMKPASPNWRPPVQTCSALTGDGLLEIWEQIREHRTALGGAGEFDAKRREQRVRWMWSTIRDRLMVSLDGSPAVRDILPELERAVTEDRMTPGHAAERVLAAFGPKDGE